MDQKAALMDGRLNPFGGPIKNNSGQEMVAAGAAMTPENFNSLNWYVEGIDGSVPK